MGGWGTLLDRVSSWLPFKTADQRRRDKIDAIKKELNEITSKADGGASNVARYSKLVVELSKLQDEANNK